MYALILTGGPCAGKTSIIEALKPIYSDQVHFVPEAATDLAENGYPMPGPDMQWSQEWQNKFQVEILERQIELEAEATDSKKSLAVLDRSRLDGLAYLGLGVKLEEVYPSELHGSFEGIRRQVHMRPYRYDQVIHLETLAAAAGYESATNLARFEDPKDAVYRDYRLQMVYRETSLEWSFLPAKLPLQAKIRAVSKAIDEVM